MKKALALLLAVLMLLSMAACSGKTADSTPSDTQQTQDNAPAAEQETPASADPVVITVWDSGGFESWYEEFNNTVGKEKGIVVESVPQGSDVAEKIKTLAQAEDWKSFPDAAFIYAAGLGAVIQMDPLVPVGDLYASGKYDILLAEDDLVDNCRRAFTFEDKLISMPMNTSSMLMYYNKDAVREAGLDPEDPPKTLAELAEWTDKLTVRDGSGNVTRYGLNLQIDRYELVNFLIGVGENGVNYIGDNEGGRKAVMTKLTIGEDGSLDKFLTEWSKVIATGGYKAVNDNEKEEFGAQLSAINFQSCAQLGAMMKLAEANGFELGAAPIPACTAEDSMGASVGGGSFCCFSPNGDEAKLAATFTFVQWMSSEWSQLRLFEAMGYLPVCKSAYESDDMKAAVEAKPLSQVAIDQLFSSNPDMQEPFDMINWELNTLVSTNMIDFAAGSIDQDECVNNIVDGFNAKLTEYLRANG